MTPRLSHIDRRGRVKMVDVGDKPVTDREAIARGSIRMSREALRQIRRGTVKKGDPLQAARLAGIMAAKQTSAPLPLCHPTPPPARRGTVKKGDPLQAARLAGIMAAKQTSALIPLCHPLSLSKVDVELTPTARGYTIESRVRTSAQTGVEMEALTAVAVAALTIYDMVKAVDKSMVIGGIELVEKKGGKSGHYRKLKVKS